jgi:hypothetical protein
MSDAGARADGERAIIRPVRLDDAEALRHLARQAGVIETTMALPSLRLEQRRHSLEQLRPDDHYFVAEVAGVAVGLAGRTRHSASLPPSTDGHTLG